MSKTLKQLATESTSLQTFLNHADLTAALTAEYEKLKKPAKVKGLNVLDIIKTVTEARCSSPILCRTMAIKDGLATSTDADLFYTFKAPEGFVNGVYGVDEFLKAKRGIQDLKPDCALLERYSLEDFPTSPKFEPLSDSAIIKINDVERVLKAVSTEETRHYLNGIFIDSGKIVATDGHRLHIAALAGKGFKTIVPTKFWQVAIKIAKSLGQDTLRLETSADLLNVRVMFNDCSILQSKTIDGSYPDYERSIPKTDSTWLKITIRESLLKEKAPAKAFLVFNEDGRKQGLYNFDNVLLAGDDLSLEPIVCAVNFTYLQDSGCVDWLVDFNTKRNHVVSPLKAKGGKAVLMPQRTNINKSTTEG